MSYQQPPYGGGYAPYGQQPQYNQQPPYGYGQPQYQQTPPPPQPSPYAPPPPQSGYAPPPPATNYGAPSPPWVPQGWTALWEPSVQRWWYLNIMSRQAQLEPPNSVASPPPPPAQGRDVYYDQGPPPNGSYGGQPADSGRSDKTNMLIGAAGGLAVGAIGGALIADALDDDDHDDERRSPPPGEFDDYPRDGPGPGEEVYEEQVYEERSPGGGFEEEVFEESYD